MTKWVYAFGDGKAEGKSAMRDLILDLADISEIVPQTE